MPHLINELSSTIYTGEWPLSRPLCDRVLVRGRLQPNCRIKACEMRKPSFLGLCSTDPSPRVSARCSDRHEDGDCTVAEARVSMCRHPRVGIVHRLPGLRRAWSLRQRTCRRIAMQILSGRRVAAVVCHLHDIGAEGPLARARRGIAWQCPVPRTSSMPGE